MISDPRPEGEQEYKISTGKGNESISPVKSKREHCNFGQLKITPMKFDQAIEIQECACVCIYREGKLMEDVGQG